MDIAQTAIYGIGVLAQRGYLEQLDPQQAWLGRLVALKRHASWWRPRRSCWAERTAAAAVGEQVAGHVRTRQASRMSGFVLYLDHGTRLARLARYYTVIRVMWVRCC